MPLSLRQRKFHLELCVTIAGAGRAPLDRLWHAIPYPTISEVWLRTTCSSCGVAA
jgi:hypothetical protein